MASGYIARKTPSPNADPACFFSTPARVPDKSHSDTRLSFSRSLKKEKFDTQSFNFKMKLSSTFVALGMLQAVLAQSIAPSPTESIGCEPHGDHW